MMEYGSAIADLDARDHGGIDAPPVIGVDDRRMQVRAYNHWSTLLGHRQWPAIEDLDLAQLDFGDNAVLLDFTMGQEDPAIVYLGKKLWQQGGLSGEVHRISQVPRGSLVSRLTDHYMQIIANGTPIGFEAEYQNPASVEILYRGILLPFSSDDESIDFILGVLNWKEAVPAAEEAALHESVADMLRSPLVTRSVAAWADGPHADHSLTNMSGDGLYNHLADARIFADQARDESARGRAALYRAVGKAWDFALAAEAEPDVLREMLEDCGVKAQARAPMTAIAKLVFGPQYDKTRLAEISAILGYARDQQLPEGSVAEHLERTEGGIKALVKKIRAAKREAKASEPKAPSRKNSQLIEKLRRAAPMATIPDAGEGGESGEIILLVARRDEQGHLAVVGRAETDEALLQRAIKTVRLDR